MLKKAFRKNRIESFVSHFLNSVETTKSIWKEDLKKSENLNITYSMMRNTLQSALATMFSDSAQNKSKEIIRDFGILSDITNLRIPRAFNFPHWVPTPENLKLKWAITNLHLILTELIEKRRSSNTEYQDLLNFLMTAIDEDTGKVLQMKN